MSRILVHARQCYLLLGILYIRVFVRDVYKLEANGRLRNSLFNDRNVQKDGCVSRSPLRGASTFNSRVF